MAIVKYKPVVLPVKILNFLKKLLKKLVLITYNIYLRATNNFTGIKKVQIQLLWLLQKRMQIKILRS